MWFIVVLKWIQNVDGSCSVLRILEVLAALSELAIPAFSILVEAVVEQRIFAQVYTVEGWIGIDALLLFDCYQVLIILLVLLINLFCVHYIRLVALCQLLHFSDLINFGFLCFGPLLSLSVSLFDHLTHCSLFGYFQYIWHSFGVDHLRCLLWACLTVLWLLLDILRPCLHVGLEAFLTLDNQIVDWLKFGLRAVGRTHLWSRVVWE